MEILLVVVVILLQHFRSQASYVPRVKELVRNETEPVRVLGALPLGPTARHQHATIVVLQSATGLGGQVQEPIFFVWSLFPKRLLCLNNLGNIFCCRACIPKGFAAQGGQMMFRTTHLKRLDINCTHQNRAIDQLVEISRPPCPRITNITCRQTGCHLGPIRQRVNANNVRMMEHVRAGQESCSTRQERKVPLDPIGPNTHLVAIQRITNRYFLCSDAFNRPMVFVFLLEVEGDVGFAVHGSDVFDLPRILANEIAAWRPDRHHEFNFRFSIGGDRDLNFDPMRLRLSKRQSILHGRKFVFNGFCHSHKRSTREFHSNDPKHNSKTNCNSRKHCTAIQIHSRARVRFREKTSYRVLTHSNPRIAPRHLSPGLLWT